jgi:hypothetical protein
MSLLAFGIDTFFIVNFLTNYFQGSLFDFFNQKEETASRFLNFFSGCKECQEKGYKNVNAYKAPSLDNSPIYGIIVRTE